MATAAKKNHNSLIWATFKGVSLAVIALYGLVAVIKKYAPNVAKMIF